MRIEHDPVQDTVVVELRSEGTITGSQPTDSGIGLDALRRTASHVSLRNDDQQVVLTVVLA